MESKVIDVVDAVTETVKFKGGTSVTESIVVIMITGTVIYCTVRQIDIPPLVTTAFGIIMGWLFKRNAKGDDHEK